MLHALVIQCWCACHLVSHDAAAERISEYIRKENSYYEGVSSEPIQLTLSGPDLPTVTLVDLPGKFICSSSSRHDDPEMMLSKLCE